VLTIKTKSSMLKIPRRTKYDILHENRLLTAREREEKERMERDYTLVRDH